MTADPVTRAARRQNLLDALAEQLTDWGCPPDLTHPRAAGLLHLAETHGWTLPAVPAPPRAGPGSTREGINRARRIYEQTRRGCRCGPDIVGRDYPWHATECPVRGAGRAQDRLNGSPPSADTPDPIPTSPTATGRVPS